jgi:hypothetical protein
MLDHLTGGRRNILIISIGAAVLVVIAFFLVRVMNAEDSKQRILMKAFANLSEAETLHTKANLELTLPVQMGIQERPILEVGVEVEGDVRYQDATPEMAGTLFMEARGRGMRLFTDGDVYILSDSVAFYLDNLPSLLNPTGSLIERWTYVDVPLLTTRNPDDVQQAFITLFEGMTYVGEDIAPDDPTERSSLYFTKQPTGEEQELLIETLRQSVSGNRGLHVIVRLLRGFDVSSVNVWVDRKGPEIRTVQAIFMHPEDEEQRAMLQMTFTEYGKDVVIDPPERELSVRPDVFVGLFGAGEIEEIEEEEVE